MLLQGILINLLMEGPCSLYVLHRKSGLASFLKPYFAPNSGTLCYYVKGD